MSTISWKELNTTPKIEAYLTDRIDKLTDGLKDITFKKEKKNRKARIKWVAEIIFHAFRYVFYQIAWKIGHKHLWRVYAVQSGTKMVSRFRALQYHKTLLSKCYNSHNLRASKIYLEKDLTLDGKPFKVLHAKGICAGIGYLFTLLYLQAEKKISHFKCR